MSLKARTSSSAILDHDVSLVPKTTGLDYAKVEKATEKLQEVQGELHRLSGNLPNLIRTEVQAQMGRDITELLKAWPSHLKMMESMGKDVLELKVFNSY